MKKIYSALFITLCFSATMSCQKEADFGREGDGIAPEGMKQITLTASSERTKTTISDGHTLWADGDNIAVISSDGSISDPFNLVGGQGSAEAEFNGYIPSGTTPTYAVYPAERCSSVSGSTIKISIPASREGDFGSGNVAVAKVASGNKLKFKNVTAFISFTLPAGTDVTSVVVESVDGSNLAGVLSIDCSGATPAPTTIESGASSITTTTSSGAGTYYIAIAPGVTHAKGFKMSYKKGDDVTGIYYLNRNITTAVNTNYQMGEVETNGNYYVTVSGAGDKNGMNWANAMSAEQMWKKLKLAGTDDQIDAAKLASIDGAVFHLAAGTYDFGTDPTLSFEEENPVALTIKGGYNASTGVRDIEVNATNFTAADGYSSLIVSGKIELSLDGVKIKDNTVNGDKQAALMVSGSGVTVNMVDCEVSGNRNDTSNNKAGAGISLSNGNLNATHVTFSNNEAYTAPALYNDHANITMTECVFDGNSATNYCGAIRLRDGGTHSFTCTFTECTFSNNSAVNDYGCIQHSDGGTCVFNDCAFTGNSAGSTSGHYGGAVGVTGTRGSVTFNGGTLTGNTAYSGGAIASRGGSFVEVKDATLSGNSANSRGGAVYAAATTNIVRCQVLENHASWGGAINVYGSDITLQIYGGTIKDNYAYNGGAILASENSSVTIAASHGTGTLLQDNYVANGANQCYGGAIRIESKNANFNCSDATFIGNNTDHAGTAGEARAFGGAISIGSDQNGVKANITDCIFEANYSSSGAGSAISYQSSGGEGNGDGSGYMRVSGCTFTGNYNSYSGSASDIALHAGAVRLGHDATPSYFEDCTFTGNYTLSANSDVKSAYGGAICYYADGKAYLNHCHFEGNHATRGGAISAVGASASGMYLNGCSFSGNWISYSFGTAIYFDNTKSFLMNNCSFADNTYTQRSGGDEGNWVYVNGSSDKSLQECVISNCSLIGSARSGSGLTVLTNGQELVYILNMKSGKRAYMINNSIIASGTEQYSWWTNAVDCNGYNNVYSAKGNSGGSYTASNDSGSKSAANLGALTWNNNTWEWNGTLSGGYTAITASSFASQLNTACPDFKTWLEENGELNKDQLGHDRGSEGWWPGAYQEGAI